MRASVIVSNSIPAAGNGDKSPWELFTGHKPSGRAHRVLLCLAYYKVVNPSSKVHARARRALHVGRAEDQPGYVLIDSETGRVVVTPHARFCETYFPGFTKAPGGGSHLQKASSHRWRLTQTQ